ncbi:uncharacterized protein LOC121306715 [Polyodon spathula]|uniref:uncharacterized protein LOC121306715 n=1 Tax=Polyodon spathula TaxID=7913 RepID=UPI001B7E1C7A|nr:uncharacterized protein LOC121306715 [Polyodon spathula]
MFNFLQLAVSWARKRRFVSSQQHSGSSRPGQERMDGSAELGMESLRGPETPSSSGKQQKGGAEAVLSEVAVPGGAQSHSNMSVSSCQSHSAQESSTVIEEGNDNLLLSIDNTAGGSVALDLGLDGSGLGCPPELLPSSCFSIPMPMPAGSSEDQDECPICTEPYDGADHRRALLNCKHAVCSSCLDALQESSSRADIGRVSCPLCRQNTPMLEWEIRRMQEEMVSQFSCSAYTSSQQSPLLPLPAPPFPGATLERQLQTTGMSSCLVCLRCPTCLLPMLGRSSSSCPCCYRLSLLEMSCVLLLSLPVIILVLLCTARQ